MLLTLSVRSLPDAGDPLKLPPVRPVGPRGAHLAGHARHLGGQNEPSWSTMMLMVSFNSSGISPLTSTVIFFG